MYIFSAFENVACSNETLSCNKTCWKDVIYMHPGYDLPSSNPIN